jgi:hypothetical protein
MKPFLIAALLTIILGCTRELPRTVPTPGPPPGPRLPDTTRTMTPYWERINTNYYKIGFILDDSIKGAGIVYLGYRRLLLDTSDFIEIPFNSALYGDTAKRYYRILPYNNPNTGPVVDITILDYEFTQGNYYADVLLFYGIYP